MGVNDVKSGNPILHGETQAINNCSRIFVAKKEEGGMGLTGKEAGEAWKDLSLYTNGEPCPMVSSYIFPDVLFGVFTLLGTMADLI